MSTYALDNISDADLFGSNLPLQPIEQNHQLTTITGNLISSPERYKRLDLAYYVHVLAQFMHHPWREHWDATLRVVQYLKSSTDQGIFLSFTSSLRLSAYCDAD